MKRRWFQVHLSTAVVVMFVSAQMLWLNLTPKIQARLEPGQMAAYDLYGWPLIAFERYRPDSSFTVIPDDPQNPFASKPSSTSLQGPHWNNLILNILIFVIAVALPIIVLESRIRCLTKKV
jgi:hypothetical protein